MERKRGRRFSTVTLTYIALLTALQIVLGNVLQVPFLGKQFTFGFLPIAVAGALVGPVGAAIVGAAGDFLGAHLFPQGAYFVGFTLTNALVGAGYGLLLYKRRPAWLWVALATAVLTACNLFLNSLWLSMLYSSRAYWGWVSVRAVTYAIEAPLQVVITYFTLRGLQKLSLPEELRLPSGRSAAGRSAGGEGKETQQNAGE